MQDFKSTQYTTFQLWIRLAIMLMQVCFFHFSNLSEVASRKVFAGKLCGAVAKGVNVLSFSYLQSNFQRLLFPEFFVRVVPDRLG
ncbi:hypothetical protein DW103_00720 [Parabacteroides sp. AM08-6]|nr:hypothetical protein DW103_00720 [Parabacteroides sp. AM08-6]